MIKYKNDVVFLLFLFLGCMCWCFCLNSGENLIDKYGVFSFRIHNESLNTEKLNEIVEWQKKNNESDVELTAWEQKDSQEIKSNNGIIKSDVIYIWGKSNYELKLQAENSCAISADKAYELWKSSDVLGKIVDINGVSYKITAVLNDVTDIAMVKASKYNENTTYDALDIKVKSRNWSLDEFKAENSLSPDVTVNYHEFSEALYKVALFPEWIIAFIMLVKIIYKLYINKNNNLKSVFMGITLILWIFLSLKLCQFSFELPQSLIPTRWSNFEFWGKTFDNMKQQNRILKLMKVYYVDEYFKKTLVNIIVYCILGSSAFLISFKYIKIRDINNLIILEILVPIISFVSTLVVMNTGTYPDFTLGYWTMIPLYIAFKYFIEHFKLSEGDTNYGDNNIREHSEKIF